MQIFLALSIIIKFVFGITIIQSFGLLYIWGFHERIRHWFVYMSFHKLKSDFFSAKLRRIKISVNLFVMCFYQKYSTNWNELNWMNSSMYNRDTELWECGSGHNGSSDKINVLYSSSWLFKGKAIQIPKLWIQYETENWRFSYSCKIVQVRESYAGQLLARQ